MSIDNYNTAYWIPLESIVKAALADDYDDSGVMKQRFNHWAMRGYRKLSLNLLRRKGRFIIPVDKNTFTAWFPVNALDYIFIGYINQFGKMIPLGTNHNLVPSILVEDTTSKKCECSCSCNHSICDAVKYEVIEETVVIDGEDKPRTIKRFIHADGTYIEEITEWYKNYANGGAVEEKVTSKNLCKLELEVCGCVKNNPTNIRALSGCGCYQAYKFCGNDDYKPINSNYDGYYNVSTEAGLIQVGNDFTGSYLYVECIIDVPCVKGIVYVPSVAKETIVNYTLYKRIQSKLNVSVVQKREAYDAFRRERREMRKNMTRMSVLKIIEALTILPEY